MSGFNVELPLPKENFLFQRKYLICIHFRARRRRTLTLREERSVTAIKFNSTLLSFSFFFPDFPGVNSQKCFNRSRGAIRDSTPPPKKKKWCKRACAFWTLGLGLQRSEHSESSQGRGSGKFPFHLPPPFFSNLCTALSLIPAFAAAALQPFAGFKELQKLFPRWWSVCILHLPLAPWR